MDIRLHSLETFGVHDGPGIRLVLFLQGCQFRCLYCHNPDTQSQAGGTQKSVDDIVTTLKKQLPYIKHGGLTVSGGEPTLQTQALIELFKQAKNLGIHTALDTNGGIHTQATKELYTLTDLLILDVKHIDAAEHKKLTGHDNSATLQNAHFREEQGKPQWLRYVLVPGWTDQPESLHAWGSYFKTFHSVERVELLPYHTLGIHKYDLLGKPYPLKHLREASSEDLAQAKGILDTYLPHKVHTRARPPMASE
jgi:pyruvate formate lyase activating enzyme